MDAQELRWELVEAAAQAEYRTRAARSKYIFTSWSNVPENIQDMWRADIEPAVDAIFDKLLEHAEEWEIMARRDQEPHTQTLMEAAALVFRSYRTKTGLVLTDSDIEELAREAERGYDVGRET